MLKGLLNTIHSFIFSWTEVGLTCKDTQLNNLHVGIVTENGETVQTEVGLTCNDTKLNNLQVGIVTENVET